MHKHRRNRVCGRKPTGGNANFRLQASVSDKIIGLLNELPNDDENFGLTYLRSQYLSKYCDESVTPASVRRERAIAKWLAQDELNRATNMRLTTFDEGFNIMPRVTMKSFLRFARKLVERVLGSLFDDLVIGDFSGGASTSRTRRESHRAFKFGPKADATMACVDFVPLIRHISYVCEQYHLFDDVNIVEGAVLFTVPKKSDIDRCAAKEPDLNMYLQKGAGNHIRRSLRRVGINLNDQSRNRNLARVASITGDSATIDLSSASDSITIELVRLLLPTEWFEYLDAIRSPVVSVDGTPVRTQMFSSMGNGFTFELESLIFWALARTVSYFTGSEGVISVYGDDIICPSGDFDILTYVLGFFGFRTNSEKSFATGGFRESCGGHYYYGVDVTPFYLKRKPTRLTDLIRVCNQLRRWILADPFRQYELPAMYNIWLSLATFVPRDLWGGDDFSLDTALVSPGAHINRLVRLTEPEDLPDTGLYVSWHHSNRERDSISQIEASDAERTSQFCRRRRVPLHGRYKSCEKFYEELL